MYVSMYVHMSKYFNANGCQIGDALKHIELPNTFCTKLNLYAYSEIMRMCALSICVQCSVRNVYGISHFANGNELITHNKT